MAEDNSIEQGDKIARFLSERASFKPVTGELAGDAAIRVIGEQDAELAELRASLKATKGHATRVKNQVTVLRETLSPTARKVGRPVGTKSSPAEPYSPELAAIAIAAGEPLEIVFSDGKQEIVALAPVRVEGPAWLQVSGGWMLRAPVLLEAGDSDAQVAGFALLSGGEQIGWRELPTPIAVPKNRRVQIEQCIVF